MKNYLLSLPLILATILLAYCTERSDFMQMILLYGVLFGGFIAAYRTVKTKQDVWFFISIAVVLRLIWLFAMPNLSDDVFRFIWDGRLLLNGINPFDELPTYYMTSEAPSLVGIDKSLFEQLNSPNYFTIYPPVAQGLFAFACWLFPNSIWGSMFVMKLFLFILELGNIYVIYKLVQHFKLPLKRLLLYVLNPLIIIEIVGNLHFEGAMIFFFLLAIWLLIKQKWVLSALAIALSVASKLLTLMFLPFWIKRLGWKKSFLYFSVCGILLIALFFPLFSGVFVSNFGDSLNLYFQKFEFNASLYYVLRWLGFQKVGYNLIAMIGPTLALTAGFSIVAIAIFKDNEKAWASLPKYLLFAFSIYLFCGTTVHPWYTALPIVLCLFTNYRFPILWSGLIFLTYINYSYGEYYENLWIVGLEYVGVFLYLIWEIREWRMES